MQQWNAKCLIALNFVTWMQILIAFQSCEFASNMTRSQEVVGESFDEHVLEITFSFIFGKDLFY